MKIENIYYNNYVFHSRFNGIITDSEHEVCIVYYVFITVMLNLTINTIFTLLMERKQCIYTQLNKHCLSIHRNKEVLISPWKTYFINHNCEYKKKRGANLIIANNVAYIWHAWLIFYYFFIRHECSTACDVLNIILCIHAHICTSDDYNKYRTELKFTMEELGRGGE